MRGKIENKAIRTSKGRFPWTDVTKKVFKGAINKAAEAAGDLVGSRISDKITPPRNQIVSYNGQILTIKQSIEGNTGKEIIEQISIPLAKRHQVIDILRLLEVI